MVSEAGYSSTSVVAYIGLESKAYDSVDLYVEALSRPVPFSELWRLLSLPSDQRGTAYQREVSSALLGCWGALDPSDSVQIRAHAETCGTSLLSFGFTPDQAQCARENIEPLICAMALEGQWLRELCITGSQFRDALGRERPFVTEGVDAPQNIRAMARIVRAYAIAQCTDLIGNVAQVVAQQRLDLSSGFRASTAAHAIQLNTYLQRYRSSSNFPVEFGEELKGVKVISGSAAECYRFPFAPYVSEEGGAPKGCDYSFRIELGPGAVRVSVAPLLLYTQLPGAAVDYHRHTASGSLRVFVHREAPQPLPAPAATSAVPPAAASSAAHEAELAALRQALDTQTAKVAELQGNPATAPSAAMGSASLSGAAVAAVASSAAGPAVSLPYSNAAAVSLPAMHIYGPSLPVSTAHTSVGANVFPATAAQLEGWHPLRVMPAPINLMHNL